jgi:hypothetical protein
MCNFERKKHIKLILGDNCRSIRTLSANIFALIKYWSQIKGSSCTNNINLVAPLIELLYHYRF